MGPEATTPVASRRTRLSPEREVNRVPGRMPGLGTIHTVEDVNARIASPQTTDRPLVLGLGAFALVRPAIRIVEDRAGLDLSPAAPIAATIAVTVVWTAAAVLTRVRDPLTTLLYTGLTYGLLSIVLSAVLSPLLLGHLEGPLARPRTIVPVLIVNAIWGLIAGTIALMIQRARRDTTGGTR